MDTFPLFPQLPTELRLYIWRLTFPGPRHVSVTLKFKDGGFDRWFSKKTTPRTPIALQVCHESREEALTAYTLSFGTETSQATIYFNYEKDILCFSNKFNTAPESLGYDKGPSLYVLNLWQGDTLNGSRKVSASEVIGNGLIRSLVLDVDELIYGRPAFIWKQICSFQGLREIVVVAWSDDERAGELMSYFDDALKLVKESNPGWEVPKISVKSSSGKSWGALPLIEDGSV